MSDVVTKKSFWESVRDKYDDLKKSIEANLSLVASVSALALGGLTLLFYALSIGQLPEFTWNDLTGTLLAVCVTGVLVVGLSVAYCLIAGYFARAALESVYPEAAHDARDASSNPNVPSAPHARLTRGPFAMGVIGLSTLAWVAVGVLVWPQRLVAPYQEHLVRALIVAAASLVVLLLVDWRRFRRQRLRYVLLSVLGGALTVVCAIIAAWFVAPDNLLIKAPSRSAGSLPNVDWVKCGIWVLDQAVWIGVSVAATLMLLINIRAITSWVAGCVRWLMGKMPSKVPDWKWRNRVAILAMQLAKKLPWLVTFGGWLVRIVTWLVRFVAAAPHLVLWLVQALKWTSHVVVGEATDLRLINAKIRVIIVFGFCASAVFFIAFAIAGAGDTHEWIVHFIYMYALLIVLNWALFSVRHWKERAGLGLVTAALVFGIYPMLTHNFSMFPKVVVSLLGLGNERLASVALSSKQCATLAPYGVSCAPDNERTITLTNVNLLNRLGGSVVLELLIEDESAAPRKIAVSSGSNSPLMSSDRERASLVPKTLMTSEQMGVNSPASASCDTVLVSNLDSSDAINARALRCVDLIVPKDQILGYTTSRSRNYRGNYTTYQPAPAKTPMTVRVIGDNVGASGDKAALSVASTTR